VFIFAILHNHRHPILIFALNHGKKHLSIFALSTPCFPNAIFISLVFIFQFLRAYSLIHRIFFNKSFCMCEIRLINHICLQHNCIARNRSKELGLIAPYFLGASLYITNILIEMGENGKWEILGLGQKFPNFPNFPIFPSIIKVV
jgi:hypothetical protein